MADPIKARLAALMQRPENKICIDCPAPGPTWASLNNAVFMCLECSGQHRGLGVHLSFVRSCGMDTWKEEQVARMELGGNAAFREAIKASPSFREAMSISEKYNAPFAEEYRAQLNTKCAAQGFWQPASAPPSRPASSQSTRKSRRDASSSPSTTSSSSSQTLPPQPQSSSASAPTSERDLRRAANENYFASLGAANASRSADHPPSQGGRYVGFGSTPAPAPASDDAASHPSFALSSRAAPSLDDFQRDPMSALTKSWGFFSTAVGGAAKAIQDGVVAPGLERVRDPAFSNDVRGYLDAAGKWVGDAAQKGNEWSKRELGVDVNTYASRLGSTVAPPPRPSGSGTRDGDDFFASFDGDAGAHHAAARDGSYAVPVPGGGQETVQNKGSAAAAAVGKEKETGHKKKGSWGGDEEWADF